MSVRLMIVMLMTALLPSTVIAQAAAPAAPVTAPVSVSTAALTKALVDGKPWNWSVPDGKKGTMTFNADGSAKMEGPMTMSIKWSVKSDEFCIAMGMMLGTKCLTAKTAPGGYQTYNKGKPAFLFTR